RIGTSTRRKILQLRRNVDERDNTAYRREVLLSLGDSLPAALDPKRGNALGVADVTRTSGGLHGRCPNPAPQRWNIQDLNPRKVLRRPGTRHASFSALVPATPNSLLRCFAPDSDRALRTCVAWGTPLAG